MPVEIKPIPDSISLSIPAEGVKARLRPTPSGIIPEGYDAQVTIESIIYNIRDFRHRPGHTPGARIVGDGISFDLNSQTHINAINKIIFRWFPSQASRG